MSALATVESSLVIYGHGYQPPRVEIGPTGDVLEVFPDINEKIYKECYRPLLINNGLLPNREANNNPIPDVLSFSVFASLRGWISANHPDDFNKLRENIQHLPDKEYRVLGDPFIHAILPLQSRQDKQLLVRMGKEAFEKDFGFTPKGFWPPETAIDTETLEVLSENGYEFVVLRDDQVKDRQQNPTFVKLPNGKEIAIVYFNMYRSGDVGYGEAIANSAKDFIEGTTGEQAIGVDLETFGHHKKNGVNWLNDISLQLLIRNDKANLSIADKLKYYSNHPEEKKYTQIYEGSSWSCRHWTEENEYPSVKMGRWKGTCSCAPDETNREKCELYNATQDTVTEINNRLGMLKFSYEESFMQAIHTKVPTKIYINGQYLQAELSVVDRIFAGVYDDIYNEGRKEVEAVANFLPTLKKAIAEVFGVGPTISYGHPLFELFLLYAAKVFSLISLTSCAEFFPESHRSEQEIARKMDNAARQMLDLHKEYAQEHSFNRRSVAA